MSPDTQQSTGERQNRRQRSGLTPADICSAALELVRQLTGRPADTVSAVERTDDGWRIQVELVELERIPASTSVLATYEVRLDRGGGLDGYRRIRRYYRNAADGGDA